MNSKNEISMEEIKEIRDSIINMNKSIDSIQRDTTLLKVGVIGSKELKIKGYGERLDCAEKEIRNYKKERNMVRGGLIVLGFIFGLLKAFWNKLF